MGAVSKSELPKPLPEAKLTVPVKPAPAVRPELDPPTSAITPEISPEDAELVNAIVIVLPGLTIRAGKFEVSGARLLVPDISRIWMFLEPLIVKFAVAESAVADKLL
jgi:hypothetical protein